MSKIKVNLVSGGAGFLGSHLIDDLLSKNQKVICLDNFFTGREVNLHKWLNNPLLEIINHDINNPINLNADKIWHLACPASPALYKLDPINTTRTIFNGTINMLDLAKKNNAKILFASSSEIYGNPLEHPQEEKYTGSVNPIGERSCYEEGKRIGESLCFDFMRLHNTKIRIARIFNSYGPRMLKKDGRVISNFVVQALQNLPISIYGDGNQTRSFCYVNDTIDGLMKLMDIEYYFPVNIGNPKEYKIIKIAKIIKEKTFSNSKFVYKDLPVDDPIFRKPDISIAKSFLDWHPKVDLSIGLDKTINYFRGKIK